MLFRNRQLRRALILGLDILAIFFSFLLSWYVRFSTLSGWENGELYISMLVVTCLLYGIIFFMHDNNREGIVRQGVFENLVSVTQNTLFLLAYLMVYLFVTQQAILVSRYVVGFMFLFFLGLDFLFRITFRSFLIRFAGTGFNATNIMLITLSQFAPKIIRRMNGNKYALMNISCITLLDDDRIGRTIEGIPVVGNRDNYLDSHRENVYDEVFIHLPYTYKFELKKLVLGFEQMGVTVNLNIEIFNIDTRAKTIRTFGDYQVVSYAATVHNPFALLIKRVIDIGGSIIGLMICAICWLIFSPIIKITSPGPVFFAQTRVGINGRRFKIYKFRTMYIDAEERKAELMKNNEMKGLMFKMENDPRITPIGQFLRKSSIDEFPQFWNVLKGDMSIVGTRPPTEDEYLQYENYHMRRLSIRPGITGMWQVSGRSDIKDFEDVVKLDLKYIDEWSLLLDFKLIFMTVGTVIFRKGAR